MQLALWRLGAKRSKKGRFGGLSFFARSPRFWALLMALLTLCALVYYPGLKGPFLFDDFANLPPLGETGPIRSAASFARYITSGTADPTGRPVALLTFLFDANDWPADPFSFKRTNLILHLINGVLLAVLLRKLGSVVITEENANVRIENAALVGTALWMLHPLFVSTTLYVVQREAMLPATTTLVGLLLWLALRSRLSDGRSGTVWSLTIAILCTTVVGALSKANGALLPLFIVAIECCTPRCRAETPAHIRRHKIILAVVAYLPSVAIALYLAWQGVANTIHGISYRSWTLAERLLTEPRVVWDYLRLLWMPTPFTSGVFNDAFPVSTSLTAPWTTLAAIIGLILIGAGAWIVRQRHPALSLAILFFLVGHSLESTTVPLELYFEHRNYVPSLLMFWPLALWMSKAVTTHGKPPVWKTVLCLASVVGMSAMTYANATLWGDASNQALVWARMNPASPRAQVLAAQYEVAQSHPELAIDRLAPLLVTHPEQVQVSLNLISAECAMGSSSSPTLHAAETSMRTSLDSGSLLTSWFMRAISVAKTGSCKGLTLDALDSLARAGTENRKLPVGREQDLVHVRGQIALAGGHADLASRYFKQATLLEPAPALALTQAAALGSAGFPQLALEQLSYYRTLRPQPKHLPFGMPRLHAWVLEKQGYWDHEIDHLEDQLQSDIMSGASRTIK